MFKSLVLFAIIHLLSISAIDAQDSILQTLSTVKLKVGIYKKESEFINNNPSILKPFSLKLLYDTCNDGIIVCYTRSYSFADSVKRKRHIYGFCDGKKVFIKIPDINQYISPYPIVLFPKIKFYMLKQVGRFSYAVVRIHEMKENGYSGIGGIGKWLRIPQIWFFNKKGNLTYANDFYISELLKKDKDLLKEFKNEKDDSYKICEKYLIKMNQRYP